DRFPAMAKEACHKSDERHRQNPGRELREVYLCEDPELVHEKTQRTGLFLEHVLELGTGDDIPKAWPIAWVPPVHRRFDHGTQGKVEMDQHGAAGGRKHASGYMMLGEARFADDTGGDSVCEQQGGKQSRRLVIAESQPV